MITSLILGDKKNLLIGGAVVIGLIALASAGRKTDSKPALNGTPKRKATKKPARKKTSGNGQKTAKIKI